MNTWLWFLLGLPTGVAALWTVACLDQATKSWRWERRQHRENELRPEIWGLKFRADTFTVSRHDNHGSGVRWVASVKDKDGNEATLSEPTRFGDRDIHLRHTGYGDHPMDAIRELLLGMKEDEG